MRLCAAVHFRLESITCDKLGHGHSFSFWCSPALGRLFSNAARPVRGEEKVLTRRKSVSVSVYACRGLRYKKTIAGLGRGKLWTF